MINFTEGSYFILGAYFDAGPTKYLFFLLLLSLYSLIICANLLLIVVICVNRSLHEPMYMFLCSLFVNELYGSTGLFPLLSALLSENLAVMSYDRYLAICCPLQYNTRMTSSTVSVLIAVSWIYALLLVAVTVSLSSPLQLCGNIINKVYCDNYAIVKLACSDTTLNNIYGLISTAFTIFLPLTLIFFTYMRILKVCFSGSKQTRQKAVSTCTPHLASLLNFSFGACFEVLQSRFNMNTVPNILRILISLYWLICQPLFNPVLYGLKMSKIRDICKSLIYWKVWII
uniref:G-protein coupled receptors family 1 profile domain-containing protein n=1 Tax=Haplochromis burtoni TaxID=8153 RepID=A0A3Q2WD16_HAPBU